VKCVILELPRVTLLPDSLTLPPEKRVILCGPPLGSADLVQLVGSGVSGYIVREDVEDHLLALLKLAASGGFGLSPNATLGARREPIESLSQREQEVLALLSKGLVYKQVAESLGLSVHTIHAHVRRIHGKLRVGSRGEAITKAGALGLINLSEYLEVDD
jgi:DNA-binding NarL/FixJ family response regulator